MGSFGVLVDEHHDFGHVVEAPRQRERTDASGQHGAVGDGLGGQQVGLQVGRDAPCRERGHLQPVDALHVGQQPAGHCGHGDVGEGYLRSEGFGLGGEVHNGTGCRAGIAAGQGDDGVGVDAPVADGLVNGAAVELDAGVGHDGHGRHLALSDDVGHPLFHIRLHHYKVDSQAAVLSPVAGRKMRIPKSDDFAKGVLQISHEMINFAASIIIRWNDDEESENV